MEINEILFSFDKKIEKKEENSNMYIYCFQAEAVSFVVS